VRDRREASADADAVLVSTREYNGALPGALKSALDWGSRPWPEHPLRSKPVAVMGASTGLFGAVWAQAEVRKTLKVIGASVIETELPVALAEEAFDADGDLLDPDLRGTLGALVQELDEQARAPLGQAA